MLMLAQPIADAIRHVTPEPYHGKRIYMSPRGQLLTQQLVRELSQEQSLMILCGHYEGVDERVIERYIDMEISIGDYVLTGGELPAMVLIDAVARLQTGVLGSDESAQDESHGLSGLLEYPQYTRPRVFEGMAVPEVLLSGDHAKIAAWRQDQSLQVTAQRRPDLLKKAREAAEQPEH
jgi:tRNA (guanine37-N1)-methyltransferase